MSGAEAMDGGRRKRKRVSSSPDSGEDGRKRGRPRVEKPDASAADRRRTQIRLAQRAYRQRKESTLEELRRRVSELTNTVELMGKAFVDCRERLSASGLSDSQLADVHETCAHIDKLKSTARNPGDDCEPAAAPLEDVDLSGPVAIDRRTSLNTYAQNVPSWLDFSATSVRKTAAPADIGLGHTILLPEGTDQSHSTQHLDFNMDIPQELLQPQVNTLASGPLVSLSPPLTYSFQESTFGRRLHRAGMETAYQFLLNPEGHQEKYERAFKLSLLSKDRSELIKAVKSVLDRGADEDLDMLSAPFLHMGGAGTHYPRRDRYGNLHPQKASQDLGLVGPQSFSLLEKAAQNKLRMDITVRVPGYEGEWFDPYDVEGYLEERGIRVDPASASFIEAEIVEWPKPSTQATSVTNGPDTYQMNDSVRSDPSVSLFAAQMNALKDVDIDPDEWNQHTNINFTGVGYSDVLTGSWLNFIQPGQGSSIAANSQAQPSWHTNAGPDLTQMDAPSNTDIFQMPLSHTGSTTSSRPIRPLPQKRSVIVDIAKFIKVLTVAGVCIGRTPGYRKHDVERALAVSSFDLT